MEIKLKVQNVSNLLLLFLFLGVCTCFGQNKETQDIAPKLKGGQLFVKNFRLPHYSFDMINMIEIRFQVSQEGCIDSVTVVGNHEIEQNISMYLIDYIKSTSGNWEPRMVNGVATNSKTFVYSIVFFQNFGWDEKKLTKYRDFIYQLFDRDEMIFGRKLYTPNKKNTFIETESHYVFPINFYMVMR
jgi:hypothetical protein